MTYQTAPHAFDDARAEAFANRFVGTLIEAALAIMTSLGHRAGLFDALAAAPGQTSAALADRAGVTERYLREWLGVMVTSGVVEYDPVDRSYTLPPEHAACLTRAASPDNMAVTTQFIGVAASVEDEMQAGSGRDVGCRDGTGIPGGNRLYLGPDAPPAT